MRVAGEHRRLAREVVFEALQELGGWRTAAEVHRGYYEHHGVDTSVGGWIWAMPPRAACIDHQQTYAMLSELHEQKRIERKQINSRVVRWRAPEPQPFEDTFPEEWARELVTR